MQVLLFLAACRSGTIRNACLVTDLHICKRTAGRFYDRLLNVAFTEEAAFGWQVQTQLNPFRLESESGCLQPTDRFARKSANIEPSKQPMWPVVLGKVVAGAALAVGGLLLWQKYQQEQERQQVFWEPFEPQRPSSANSANERCVRLCCSRPASSHMLRVLP